jgi:hypothetical protein
MSGKAATVEQIRCRMDAGHAEIIEAVERLSSPATRRRGWRRRLETLIRWQCVEPHEGRCRVTDKGREALRAMRLSCGSERPR